MHQEIKSIFIVIPYFIYSVNNSHFFIKILIQIADRPNKIKPPFCLYSSFKVSFSLPVPVTVAGNKPTTSED
jgi:hypothetical protein